jgi:hypothetical protein
MCDKLSLCALKVSYFVEVATQDRSLDGHKPENQRVTFFMNHGFNVCSEKGG